MIELKITGVDANEVMSLMAAFFVADLAPAAVRANVNNIKPAPKAKATKEK